jgi:hypothetical protein
MLAHVRYLIVVQTRLFKEHAVLDADFPDVVQHSCQTQVFLLAQRYRQMPRDRHAVLDHPFDMAAGVGISFFDCGSQRFGSIYESFLQFGV